MAGRGLFRMLWFSMMAWVIIFLGPDPLICCCPICCCCCCWLGSFGLVPGSSTDLSWVSWCPANLTWEVPCPSCDSLGSVCDLTSPARPGPFTAPPWLPGSGLDVCWCPKDVLRKAPFVLMVPQIVHTQWNMPKSRYCLNPSKSIISQNTLARFSHFWSSLFLSSLYTHMQVKWLFNLAMHQTFSSVITEIPSELILSIWYQVCRKACASNIFSELFFSSSFPTMNYQHKITAHISLMLFIIISKSL